MIGKEYGGTSQQLVLRFEELQRKAEAKLERLRDLAPHLVVDLSRQYSKAFAAFNQLWVFQQSNRRVLVEAGGLRRSDIGDIASRIAHLHFNWYLRCADTRFLLESYIFYEAIHARQYYSPDNGSLFPVDGSVGNLAALGAAAAAASGTPSSSAAGQAGASLMSSVGLGGGMLAHSAAGGGLQDGMSGVVEQQLRFYARFILVCIMLSRKEEAVNLLQEFQALVAAHTMGLEPGSQQHAHDWPLVLAEVGALLTADPGMPLPRSPGAALSFRPCCRVWPSNAEALSAPHVPVIHHAVLVGYQHRQVKLAELPVDLLRMMQALEWQDDRLQAPDPASPSAPAHAHAPPPALSALSLGGAHASTSSSTPATRSGDAGDALAAHHPPPATAATPGLPVVGGIASPVGVPAGGSISRLPPSRSAIALTGTSSGGGAAGVGPGGAHVPVGAGASGPSRAAAPGPSSGPRNPTKTLLYRTSAPTLLAALHSAAAGLPGGDELAPHGPPPSLLLLYLSCSSMRSRLAACGGAPPTHAPQQQQQPPKPEAQARPLPPVPSASSLTASLMMAAAANAAQPPSSSTAVSSALHHQQQQQQQQPAHQHQQALCPDANGRDLADAWCLSPPPLAQSNSTPTHGAGGLGGAGGAGGGSHVVSSSISSGAGGSAAECGLLVEDLRPLTRHRLMVVADGDVAHHMKALAGSELGQPVALLLSARHRPSAFGDAARTGQLLTLFLTLPVSAFCLVMGEQDPTPPTLRSLQDAVEEALGAIAAELARALPGGGGPQQMHGAWVLPFQDALLRQLMCRFVLHRAALAYHRASTGRPECQPECVPELPDQLLPSSPVCVEAVLRIAAVLRRQALFEGYASVVASVAAPVDAAPGSASHPAPGTLVPESGACGTASAAAAAALPAASLPMAVPGSKASA